MDKNINEIKAARFKRLREVDVSKYVQERDGLSYINWVDMIGLLYENGAQVVRPVLNTNPETGSSLFMTNEQFSQSERSHRCYEIDFEVYIAWEEGDEDTLHWHGPVMNGKNPVMDNSMNQHRIWVGYVRQLVKCIAINTGLAFNLYAKAERGEEQADLSSHNVLAVKKRIEELITEKINRGMDYKDICASLGISEKQAAGVLKGADNLYWMEGELRKL